MQVRNKLTNKSKVPAKLKVNLNNHNRLQLSNHNLSKLPAGKYRITQQQHRILFALIRHFPFNCHIFSNNNNNVVGAVSVTNNPVNNTTASGLIGGGTSTAAAKNQLEQLTTMRDALFSQGKIVIAKHTHARGR